MYFDGSSMGGSTGGPEAPASSVSELDLNKDGLDYNGYHNKRGGFLHEEDYKKVIAKARDAFQNKRGVASSVENGKDNRTQIVGRLNAMAKRAGRKDFFDMRSPAIYMYDALNQALREHNPQLGSSYDKQTLTDQKLLAESILILGGEQSLADVDALKGAYSSRTIK